MKRVLLVDTSMGNLRSVARALDRAGAEVTLSADPEAVRGADRVVVPGQGHFRDCAKALAGGLGEALRAHAAREDAVLYRVADERGLTDGPSLLDRPLVR